MMKEKLTEEQTDRLWAYFDHNCPWDMEHYRSDPWPVSLRKMAKAYGVSKTTIARQYKDYVRLNEIQKAQDEADPGSLMKWREEIEKGAKIQCGRYFTDGRPTIERELCHRIQDFLLIGEFYSYRDIAQILTTFSNIIRSSRSDAAESIRSDFDLRSIRQSLLRETGINEPVRRLNRTIHRSDLDPTFEKQAVAGDGQWKVCPVGIRMYSQFQIVCMEFEKEEIEVVGRVSGFENRLKMMASKDNLECHYHALVINEKGERSEYMILRDDKGDYKVLGKTVN